MPRPHLFHIAYPGKMKSWMSRRKGELTKPGIDRRWPHQVAHPERLSCREHWRAHHAFIEEQGLAQSPIGHSFVRDGEWWNVRCFAEHEHAERFMARLGGEYMTPDTRPRS